MRTSADTHAARGSRLRACAWAMALWAWRGDRRIAVRLARASFLLTAALVTIGGMGIAERHGPRWSALRFAIRRYASEIDSAAGDRGRVLSSVEFEALRRRFFPQPVPVWFAGVGYVHIQMAHAGYPYVAVDFGEGNTVQFDPITMVCLYAD